MRSPILPSVAAFFAAVSTASASPHETKLQDAQEICELLLDLADHVHTPNTRIEWADTARVLDARFDYPVTVADFTVGAPPGEVALRQRLYRSAEEQLGADAVANLTPPPGFLARCHALARATELHSGALVPSPLGGRVDYSAGAAAVLSDGDNASVTWRHEGFDFLFQLVLRRGADGRFRVFGSRAWPSGR